MKKLIFLILLFPILGFGQKEPTWVKERPKTSMFFIGIGYCSVWEKNYIETAKKRALADLASEIATSIESTSNLNQKSTNTSSSFQLDEQIIAKTQKKLEGYENAGTYEDSKKYWVYYKLSRQDYYDRLQSSIESAINQADSSLQQAASALETKDYYKAVQNYLYAAKALDEYLNETYFSKLKERMNILSNKSFTGFSDVFAKLKVETKDLGIKIKTGETKQIELPVKLSYMNGNEKNFVYQFPVAYSFSKGFGKIASQNSVTDNQGTASNTLISVSAPDQKQLIEAKPDLDAILSKFSGCSFVENYKKIESPKGLFYVTLAQNTLFFKTSEKNLDKSLSEKILEPKIKHFFKEHGFAFVDKESKADYIITIEASTRKGNTMNLGANPLQVTFLNVNIYVTDNKSNNETYSKPFNNIKGVKNTFEDAGLSAYSKIDKTFEEQLYPELLKLFNLGK